MAIQSTLLLVSIILYDSYFMTHIIEPRSYVTFSETFDRSCATVVEQRVGWESGKIYRDVTDSDSKYLREVEEVYCSKGTQLCRNYPTSRYY